MTDRQENKLSAYLSVQQVCNTNNAVWNGLPAFVTAFGTFENFITEINDIRGKQEADRKGIAENKLNKENDLISKTLLVSSALVAFADATNNTQLRQEVDYSENQLRKARDTVIRDRCQLIHDRANDNIALLAPYGITPAQLTALQTAIDTYNDVIASPRTAIAE